MTGNAAAPAGPGPELIDSFAKLKSAIDVQVAATKRDIAQWLDQKPGQKDSTVIRIALLETALDRYLAERTATAAHLPPAAADTNDIMQAVLRRAVQRRRAALQDNKPPAVAGPADDEECANRLSEILKFLDTLADRLPDNFVSRELLASANEPLQMLL